MKNIGIVINYKKIYPNSSIFDKVIELYLSAFPAVERRDVASLKRIADSEERFTMLVATDAKDELLGFLNSWDFGTFRYGEHFAVSPASRGRGIGGKMLDHWLGAASTPVVLEVEPASTGDMAARRIGFYRRHGFTLHDEIHYVQPPYDAGLEPVEMGLMTWGGFSPELLQQAIATLRSQIYGTKY